MFLLIYCLHKTEKIIRSVFTSHKVFKSKRNVTIGEIYRPPSSDKKYITRKLLNKIEKEKNICIFDGRLQYKYNE